MRFKSKVNNRPLPVATPPETPSAQRGADHIASWTAVGVIVIGCAMLITAMLLPPPGEIDHSVLVAFGEICTFGGTVLGVSGARQFKRNSDKPKEVNENEKNR